MVVAGPGKGTGSGRVPASALGAKHDWPRLGSTKGLGGASLVVAADFGGGIPQWGFLGIIIFHIAFIPLSYDYKNLH